MGLIKLLFLGLLIVHYLYVVQRDLKERPRLSKDSRTRTKVAIWVALFAAWLTITCAPCAYYFLELISALQAHPV
jgi:hypothetical protein